MLSNQYSLKEIFTEKQILDRVKKIAFDISNKYFDDPPIFISILKGSFIFAADLIRATNLDSEIDFIEVASYSGTSSKGSITLKKDISINIKNRNIIIVEDIIDTGITIKFLKEKLEKLEPKSIAIVTLLMKTQVQNLDFKIDWVGFEIAPEFVVGYGLDFNQKFRNLRGIYILGGNESE